MNRPQSAGPTATKKKKPNRPQSAGVTQHVKPNVSNLLEEAPIKRAIDITKALQHSGRSKSNLQHDESQLSSWASRQHAFKVAPSSCNFGYLKQGCSYRVVVYLLNVSVDTRRFRVKLHSTVNREIRDQQNGNKVRVLYEASRVAAGIRKELDVVLDTCGSLGGVEDILEIVTECEIFTIPVRGIVIDANEFESRAKKLKGANKSCLALGVSATNDPAKKSYNCLYDESDMLYTFRSTSTYLRSNKESVPLRNLRTLRQKYDKSKQHPPEICSVLDELIDTTLSLEQNREHVLMEASDLEETLESLSLTKSEALGIADFPFLPHSYWDTTQHRLCIDTSARKWFVDPTISLSELIRKDQKKEAQFRLKERLPRELTSNT